jgi:hypothetical protein
MMYAIVGQKLVVLVSLIFLFTIKVWVLLQPYPANYILLMFEE